MTDGSFHTLDLSRRNFMRGVGLAAGVGVLVGAGLAASPASAGSKFSKAMAKYQPTPKAPADLLHLHPVRAGRRVQGRRRRHQRERLVLPLRQEGLSGHAAAWVHPAGRGAAAFAFALIGLSATNAAAVPAFAAQTGEPCQACHVGGFGPQLTTFGREFKLQGFTLRTNDKSVPLSAMVVASYLRTQKAQNPPPTPQSNPNDNWALDQVSLFFAGGFGQHFGAFVQGTYDGIAQAWTWDQLDLRAVTTAKVDKHDVTFGLGLNNNPTVQHDGGRDDNGSRRYIH